MAAPNSVDEALAIMQDDDVSDEIFIEDDVSVDTDSQGTPRAAPASARRSRSQTLDASSQVFHYAAPVANKKKQPGPVSTAINQASQAFEI